jgi:NADH:ubiquinone oxidoreductase subunit D
MIRTRGRAVQTPTARGVPCPNDAPSFINLTALAEMSKGQKVGDVVIILGSIDIVLGETDR